jgi:hypothetical protein
MHKMLVFQREVFDFNIYTRHVNGGYLPEIQVAYLPEINRIEHKAVEVLQIINEVFWQRQAHRLSAEGEAYRMTLRDLRNLKLMFEERFDYESRPLQFVFHIELPVVQ